MNDENRAETESLTQHLASLLAASWTNTQHLRILDLCSGTGCISLLLHALLNREFGDLRVLGVDVSPLAVNLAKENLQHNVARGHLSPSADSEVSFAQGDILKADCGLEVIERWDVLIANPPYISPTGFNRSTSRSVRNYEPTTALVPSWDQCTESDEAAGDLFYPHLVKMARRVQAKVCLFEVGDLAQAMRVSAMILADPRWAGCEIWRDWPKQGKTVHSTQLDRMQVSVRGEGQGRAIFAWISESLI